MDTRSLTLKKELELLRGEPIRERPSVAEIPCNEISDSDRLCRNPVVSVHMTTYNHESYIAEAIESIVRQKTDFEFELVIGEDASSDRTREICEEYQRKYPEIVRLLWSEENTYAYGGNYARVTARCRGEFIAICEGDDYWSDEHKLRKQVEVLRSNRAIAFCFGEYAQKNQEAGEVVYPQSTRRFWKEGVITGEEYLLAGRNAPTCTVMLRRSMLEVSAKRHSILSWCLTLGDKPLFMALALQGDVFCTHDVLSVYRNHEGGVTKNNGMRVSRDGGIVSYYYARMESVFPVGYLSLAIEQILLARLSLISYETGLSTRRRSLRTFLSEKTIQVAVAEHVGIIGLWAVVLGRRTFVFYRRIRWAIKKRIGRMF